MARARLNHGPDNRKIAVYVRKSKVTETGKSIEIQKEKCIAIARAKYDTDESGILIYEDEGKSGFYADRPMYKKLLRDIESNQIKAVVCYKIDRISRRTIDLLNLVQQMEQKGIAFISVSDHDIDTSTRTGKIMISLLAAIAEFERDIIAERITDNMYELAKEGRWLGGTCPLGYFSKKEKLVTNGKKTFVNHLEFIEDELGTVKRLFELFIKSMSITGTATALNSEGCKTKTGMGFTPQAVKNILLNPVYAVADSDMRGYFKAYAVTVWADDKAFDGKYGIMAYNKTEQTREIGKESRVLEPKYIQKALRRDITEWIVSVGKHKGIISGADWIRAQNILAEISRKQARPREISKSLLSGLVRCGECGSRMFVRAESGRRNPDGSPRFRYICDVKYRKKGGCEKSPDIKGYDLDAFVVSAICKMSEKDNTFLDGLSRARDILLLKSQETEKELKALNVRLAQIENDIRKQAANLRTAPENVRQAIYADIDGLNKERSEKRDRVRSICEQIAAQDYQFSDIEKAKQTLLDFSQLVKLAGYEGTLRLIRGIVECIVVKGDEVHIFLKGTESGVSQRTS